MFTLEYKLNAELIKTIISDLCRIEIILWQNQCLSKELKLDKKYR